MTNNVDGSQVLLLYKILQVLCQSFQPHIISPGTSPMVPTIQQITFSSKIGRQTFCRAGKVDLASKNSVTENDRRGITCPRTKLGETWFKPRGMEGAMFRRSKCIEGGREKESGRGKRAKRGIERLHAMFGGWIPPPSERKGQAYIPCSHREELRAVSRPAKPCAQSPPTQHLS